MDGLTTLALWVHFLSIGMAGMASLGIPVALMASKGATAQQRPAVGAILMKLAAFGRMAIALLIVSGLAIVWAKYGGGELNRWFHIKMVFVAAIVVLALYNKRNGAKASAGDAAAVARMPMLGKISIGLFATTILMAVLAFG